MSRSGLCAECGALIQLESARQIREREGPLYDAWLDKFQAGLDRLKAARNAAGKT